MVWWQYWRKKSLIADGKDKETDSKVAVHYSDTLLYQEGFANDNGFRKEDAYTNLRDDLPQTMKKTLQNYISEANVDGLIDERTQKQLKIIDWNK